MLSQSLSFRSILCLISLVATATLATSCSFKKESPKPEKGSNSVQEFEDRQKESVSDGIFTSEEVKFEYIAENTPNLYKVRIVWPQRVKRMILNISRPIEKINQDSGEDSPLFMRNDFSFLTKGGSRHIIKLTSVDAVNAKITSTEHVISVPMDYELQELVELTENTTINAERFYWYNRGAIATNGFNLNIKVKKLIGPSSKTTDGFDLGHYLAQSRVSPSTVNGGSISIEADQAVGHLRIGMIGRNGYSGKDAEQILKDEPYKQPKPAKNGANGEPSYTIEDMLTCDPPCRSRYRLICDKHATSGGPGENGAPGINGENGGNGGHTGNLSLMIHDSSQFYLSLKVLPGKGGIGGRGGKGFPGGKGGLAGVNHQNICPDNQLRNGSDGAPGPDGISGKSGTDGVVGTIIYNKLQNVVLEAND